MASKEIDMSVSTPSKYLLWILLTLFVATWIWAAIEPLYYDDWLIENVLVALFVPIMFVLWKKNALSSASYVMITLFMVLHVVGSHYTYSEVPFGETLGMWWGAERNMYDRLVHLGFGVLFALPIYEVMKRVARIEGFWICFVTFMVISAIAGFYEVIEWVGAATLDPEAGAAFLGTQGDEWDAQKDMILAMIGSFAFLILLRLKRVFIK